MIGDWATIDFDEHRTALLAAAHQRTMRNKFVELIGSPDKSQHFSALRNFYRLADQEIHAAGKNEWGIDPYEVNWVPLFTPIEYGLWYDIRDCNAVLYPQYPVGRYFVDFANPVAKVAIECDGWKYHQDLEKDVTRQRAIESQGWTVYRIAGRDCLDDFNEEEMQSGKSRKFVEYIVNLHRISRNHQWSDEE